MTESSPSDLAVAFHSLGRRRTEALGEAATDDEHVHAILADITAVVRQAADRLRVPADPDAIADAIHDRPADAWTDAELDGLRRDALDLGRLLRLLADVTDAT
jgi:hypothetical protein